MTSQSQMADFEFTASRLLTGWLKEAKASLVFTTYTVNKLFMIGLRDNGRLQFKERTFPRPMGVGMDENGFWMASTYQLWRFENYLAPGETQSGHDAVFVPSQAWTTGDLDIHDIHMCNGDPVFVATRFNCLAKPSNKGSFCPIWRPPFIDRYAGEDRCHLNGFTPRDGKPAYATAVSTTNVAEGWREHRRNGGIVMDIDSNEIITSGLSMPHSPRWHDGRLWMLQSGTGEFGYIDLDSGRFEAICFLPGFARGLAIRNGYALIGVSQPRGDSRVFEGLQLQETLEKEKVAPRCALMFVNLKTGDVENWIDIKGPISEIYDVGILPDIIRPQLLGVVGDDIRYQIKIAKE